MESCVDRLLRLFHGEEGATAMEYGLMVALIAVVIAGAVTTFGGVLGNSFSDVAASIGAATGS